MTTSKNPTTWTVTIKTEGGGISVTPGLSHAQARAVLRAYPVTHNFYNRTCTWSEWELIAAANTVLQQEQEQQPGYSQFYGNSYMYYPNKSDITQSSAINERGEYLNPWPKPRGWDKRLAAAVEKLRAEREAAAKLQTEPTVDPRTNAYNQLFGMSDEAKAAPNVTARRWWKVWA